MLCCSGLRGKASGDAWGPPANGSIFSRAAENVFSHLARTGPQREKLRSFLQGFERVLAHDRRAGWATYRGGWAICRESPRLSDGGPGMRRPALAPRATRVSAAGGGHPHH
ncbi:hypothetical protein B7G54_31640 [Burkholderia puraquae]|uniref:Uncharacterized protein n=1 Tax=Burkholderia puraquae TaxID=1904757 RepID=A0A1X1P892_9BURK|nr:hypothetical protein B7G54_31640 [Burkholderia puraquae]